MKGPTQKTHWCFQLCAAGKPLSSCRPQYAHWLAQRRTPEATAGPKLRAGLTEQPSRGIAARWQAKRVNLQQQWARGREENELCCV